MYVTIGIIQLERKYTKEEIFELYVNKIFMSERTVGIATASDVYFGKPLKELTLPEVKTLCNISLIINAV